MPNEPLSEFFGYSLITVGILCNLGGWGGCTQSFFLLIGKKPIPLLLPIASGLFLGYGAGVLMVLFFWTGWAFLLHFLWIPIALFVIIGLMGMWYLIRKIKN